MGDFILFMLVIVIGIPAFALYGSLGFYFGAKIMNIKGRSFGKAIRAFVIAGMGGILLFLPFLITKTFELFTLPFAFILLGVALFVVRSIYRISYGKAFLLLIIASVFNMIVRFLIYLADTHWDLDLQIFS